MLLLHCGFCSISVQAGDALLAKHLGEVAQKCPSWVQAHRQEANCTLMLMSSHGDDTVEPKWRAIGRSWTQARQGLREAHAQSLAVWRTMYQFGQPIDQRLSLFQDRAGARNSFFCLVPADTLKHPWHPTWWIIHAVVALALHWHAMHGGGTIHASGVARHGGGYLFLGSPGAGKSTIADLSERAQGTIIHEDQVMLSLHAGNYRLSHPDTHASPVLRAVFLLRQGHTNCVVPLAPRAVGTGLAKALLEYAAGQDHFGPWVRQAFHNMAEVARTVPGYVLEFRKSPDFWDVIDAELGK